MMLIPKIKFGMLVGLIVAALTACSSSAPSSKETVASAEVRPNFSGIWERTPHVMDSLPEPAFTAEALEQLNRELTPGEAVWAENGIDASDANCLPRRQPWMLLQSAPISIVHDGNKLILLYEKRSSPVHVYLDGRRHPEMEADDLSLNGHSIGRWDGAVLVVDSVGFADYEGHGPVKDLPFLPTTRIQTRYWLAADGEILHARFTISEPKWLERPYVYDFSWRRLPYATNYALVETCDGRNPDRLVY